MFRYLIAIEPLGFLYGSAGRFLSPENLVGRSGISFPPSAPVIVGLLLHALGDKGRDWLRSPENQNLRVAGPFWGDRQHWQGDSQDFWVPVPFNCLVSKGQVQKQLAWDERNQEWSAESTTEGPTKYDRGQWVAIRQWEQLGVGCPTVQAPWQFVPHLHPRLAEDERKVKADQKRGSLFLENAVAMKPGTVLVYLCTHALPDGWYRFGGEGHLVDVQSLPLTAALREKFQQPVGRSFALIGPGVWGSARLCHRYPVSKQQPIWPIQSLLTERPQPYRYRLGGQGTGRRLSRGRYAVPAGTVYVVRKELPAWQQWPEDWFPREGYPLKRWGCGLALPLPSALAANPSA
ncbi:MAG: type III-B CRISPR module-associated Cmr3 family protein [Pseudanabaenaceae cyanobacterium]